MIYNVLHILTLTSINLNSKLLIKSKQFSFKRIADFQRLNAVENSLG